MKNVVKVINMPTVQVLARWLFDLGGSGKPSKGALEAFEECAKNLIDNIPVDEWPHSILAKMGVTPSCPCCTGDK